MNPQGSIDAIIVTSPGPYPPIEVERPNLSYARLLMQDLSSPRGEMTAIYQYLYQYWAIEQRDLEFSATLYKIAAVEMHHLDVLGKLVTMLGGDPRCQAVPGNRRTAWTGNDINYTRQIGPMLLHNIAGERFACNTYLSQANAVQDGKLAAVLRKLAADENVHIGIFQRFLSSYQTPGSKTRR